MHNSWKRGWKADAETMEIGPRWSARISETTLDPVRFRGDERSAVSNCKCRHYFILLLRLDSLALAQQDRGLLGTAQGQGWKAGLEMAEISRVPPVSVTSHSARRLDSSVRECSRKKYVILKDNQPSIFGVLRLISSVLCA